MNPQYSSVSLNQEVTDLVDKVGAKLQKNLGIKLKRPAIIEYLAKKELETE